jgi:hypothetical protein
VLDDAAQVEALATCRHEDPDDERLHEDIVGGSLRVVLKRLPGDSHRRVRLSPNLVETSSA